MKKLFLILISLVLISVDIYAVDISVQNVELNLSKDWTITTKDIKTKDLILIAGLPSVRTNLFVMASQKPKLAPDLDNEYAGREATISLSVDDIYFNPIIHIYKIAADGKTVDDYKAAEIMTLRVRSGGKVLESKDNFLVATYPDGMDNIKQIEYFYVIDDFLYILLAASTQQKFDGYRQLFDEINKSLKIK
jgi:hypothetical protein